MKFSSLPASIYKKVINSQLPLDEGLNLLRRLRKSKLISNEAKADTIELLAKLKIIPEMIERHVKLGVKESDAEVLPLIEILMGYGMPKYIWKDPISGRGIWGCRLNICKSLPGEDLNQHYTINQEGYVTEYL